MDSCMQGERTDLRRHPGPGDPPIQALEPFACQSPTVKDDFVGR